MTRSVVPAGMCEWSVDREQQQVDVDERLLGQTGQDLDPVGECDQVFAQHRFELTCMTEAELAQQCSHGRGQVDVAEQMCHAARAQQVDIVDAVDAAHIPAIRVRSFGAGFAAPDAILVVIEIFSESRSDRRVCSADVITGTSPAHETRWSSSNTADPSTSLWGTFFSSTRCYAADPSADSGLAVPPPMRAASSEAESMRSARSPDARTPWPTPRAPSPPPPAPAPRPPRHLPDPARHAAALVDAVIFVPNLPAAASRGTVRGNGDPPAPEAIFPPGEGGELAGCRGARSHSSPRAQERQQQRPRPRRHTATDQPYAQSALSLGSSTATSPNRATPSSTASLRYRRRRVPNAHAG
jgi:hypothetical protein